MTRFATRSIVVLTMATLAFAGLGATSATALRTAHNPIFVGSYAIHGTITGTTEHLKGTLTVNADGTATDNHGNQASWTSSGTTFTMIFTNNGLIEKFVGKHTASGIGSKKHPGTFTSNMQGLNGTWWGVRQP